MFGALAAGALSSSIGVIDDTLQRPPGGGEARLTIATGNDPTGAVDLLISIWNRRSDVMKVKKAEGVGNTPQEQYRYMFEHANLPSEDANSIDLVNLDVIYVAEFADQGLIARLADSRLVDFLSSPKSTCRAKGKEGTGYYALPFSSNVGMLYQRASLAGGAPAVAGLGDLVSRSSKHTWTAQLSPGNNNQEAVVCNFLEHAMAFRSELAPKSPNMADYVKCIDSVDAWRDAQGALQTAMVGSKRRLYSCETTDASLKSFANGEVEYMRNWSMRLAGDGSNSAPCANALTVPRGILGGCNLALVKKSQHQDEAMELMKFLTSSEAQRILAFAGFLPTYAPLYSSEKKIADIGLDLAVAEKAIANSIVRPLIPTYRVFSEDVYQTVSRAVVGDTSSLIQKGDTDRWLEHFKS